MNKAFVLSAISLAAMLGLSACAQSNSMNTMPSMDLNLGPSLNAGVVDGGVSEVVVPMGHLSDPRNTFYQSFTSLHGGAWRLSTPHGSGTNGGIVVASPSDGAVVIRQFDQSHVAALSPLLHGQQVLLGGRIVGSLAQSPSAVAMHGSTVYLVDAQGSLEELSMNAQTATVVTTQRQLASSPAGRRCGVVAITAVAVNRSGQIALGARCDKGGTNAVFVKNRSSWWLGGAPTTTANAVMRLDAAGDGFTALVRTAGAAPSVRSIALSGSGAEASPTTAWSPPVGLMYSVVRSSVPDGHGGYDMLLANSTDASATDLAPGSLAVPIGKHLPLSAQGIVIATVGGSQATEVVEVIGGTASFVVPGRQSMWRVIQRVKVAIPYGAA